MRSPAGGRAKRFETSLAARGGLGGGGGGAPRSGEALRGRAARGGGDAEGAAGHVRSSPQGARARAPRGSHVAGAVRVGGGGGAVAGRARGRASVVAGGAAGRAGPDVQLVAKGSGSASRQPGQAGRAGAAARRGDCARGPRGSSGGAGGGGLFQAPSRDSETRRERLGESETRRGAAAAALQGLGRRAPPARFDADRHRGEGDTSGAGQGCRAVESVGGDCDCQLDSWRE
mmetsp:Transcript_23208/g.78382  ORF Transcript_23208/g.78382 Transcript_23208/m.78382 type:complete len:231 (+) Transcript_23208:1891-2583(+)